MVDAQYHRKRRRARRKMFLALLGNRCENCGSRNHLEFDHKDPSKKQFNISRFLNRPESQLIPEIKKCRLLCRKCHIDKTHNEWDYGSPPARHGTLWMYKAYHCRCSKCKEAMSTYYHARKT